MAHGVLHDHLFLLHFFPSYVCFQLGRGRVGWLGFCGAMGMRICCLSFAKVRQSFCVLTISFACVFFLCRQHLARAVLIRMTSTSGLEEIQVRCAFSSGFLCPFQDLDLF